MIKQSVIIISYLIVFVTAEYDVKLQNNGPIVQGATIRFNVSVYDDNGLTKDKLEIEWHDDGIPRHKRRVTDIKNGTDTWDVTYDAETYRPGIYIAEIYIFKCLEWINYCPFSVSARMEFQITAELNGVLLVQENNETLHGRYISTKDEVNHLVSLKQTDLDYIKKAPLLRTYWFVDCTYYGITPNLEFLFNYTQPNETHKVEALVMADFTPPVPSTTTTTSTTTTSTTTTTTATTPTPPASTSRHSTTTSVTTVKPSTTPTPQSVVKRNANNGGSIKVWKNGSLVPYNDSFPFVCNSSYISTDTQKIYGYFSREFITRDPLTKVNVTGNNWIQPGDLLSLSIRCEGSKNFEYCVKYKKGEYNVTGNENCIEYQQSDKCDFLIRRYLSYPKYTIVVIIKNDVSKVVTPVTVNIYKVKKQGQLSVIMVPVAFSLVAVVSIVFGVAYYFQNRNRFIIEVADFNFGQQYSDLEYKTFRERLRDSIANAFTRTPTPSSSEVPVWPPGRKYGSMT